MRISDWSSDVCSSDLLAGRRAVLGDQAVHVVDGAVAGRAAARDQDRAARPAQVERCAEAGVAPPDHQDRSEEHTSELQSLMRISYAVFCLKKNIYTNKITLPRSTHNIQIATYH